MASRLHAASSRTRASGATLLTFAGVVTAVVAVMREEPWWYFVTVPAIALAVMLWRNWGGGWAALLGLLIALIPGSYGVWGTSVVYGMWSECANLAVASIVASYPEAICQGDWIARFAPGIALIAVGLSGILLFGVLVVDAHAARPDQ